MTRTSKTAERPIAVRDARWRREFRRRLLAWYRRHRRDLPWRRSRDPYAVWVSEIMLQQTQVATVIGYFQRFLRAFPDLASLAAADEQVVLRLWEGLGYYRRARQLHCAARVLIAEHGGRFPVSAEQIATLPGIGRYTAGAIASIAFDQPAAILEANTARLHARLLALEGDLSHRRAQQALWQFAADLLPARGSGEVNQALMELGSLVCTPRAPSCPACPVRSLCPTRKAGLQAEIPRPKPRPALEAVREAAVVVRRGQRVLLRRRGADERWAGMWDFPRFALDDAATAEDQLAEGVRRLTGVRIVPGRRLTTIRHGVTRFRITLDCYEAKCRGGAGGHGELRWVRPEELPGIALSVSARKLARLVMPV